MLNEQAVVFDCRGEALMGVLHAPEVPADIGVVVVVGGPQYRGGSHRQFVHLARALCRAGHVVLRFDVRGMGDSQGAQRPFDQLDDDVAAAIDTLLARAQGVSRVVLWGLCDGASAAWLYVQTTADPRVAGVCAVNPWVRSPEGLARMHVKHYYVQRVLSGAFWSKLLRGDVGWRALRGLAGALKTAWGPASAPSGSSDGSGSSVSPDFRQRMAEGCARCSPGSVLLVLSGNDYTAKEFTEHVSTSLPWQEALRICAAQHCDLPGADHTLSQVADRIEVESATLRWLGELGRRTSSLGRVESPSVSTGEAA